MEHFAGLDVSVKETSICIVDDTGKIVREVKVASEPDALLQVLKTSAYRFKRIGLDIHLLAISAELSPSKIGRTMFSSSTKKSNSARTRGVVFMSSCISK